MTTPLQETRAFHAFIGEQLSVGTQQSPEDLLQAWRLRQCACDSTVAAIREGLEDVAAGRTRPLEEFDREFRQRHNIAPDDE